MIEIGFILWFLFCLWLYRWFSRPRPGQFIPADPRFRDDEELIEVMHIQYEESTKIGCIGWGAFVFGVVMSVIFALSLIREVMP